MKFVTFPSLLLFAHASRLSSLNRRECDYALELLCLQDGSSSFLDHVEKWAETSNVLLNRLSEEYDEHKIAISSFTDKPIPFSGYGRYGGYSVYPQDYCYRNHVPFTTDPVAIADALNNLQSTMAPGFDLREAQAEAMIYAALDPYVGWTPASQAHTDSDRPIARVMLLITDAPSHEAGDAKKNLQSYNTPRTYPNGYDQPSVGGFGSHAFVSSPALAIDEDLYYEMADLFALLDASEAGVGEPLTVDQESRLTELVSMYGPEHFPEPIEHPGDNSIEDCTKTEYPSLEQMILALKSQDILPIFLSSTKDAYEFYAWYQVNVFEPMGILTINAMFETADLFEDIMDAIDTLLSQKCLLPESQLSTASPEETKEETTLHTTQVVTTSVQDISVETESLVGIDSEPAGEPPHESYLSTETTEETREMVVCTTKPVTTSVEGVSIETESLTDVNSEPAGELSHESNLHTETTEETREMVVCTTKPVTTSVEGSSVETNSITDIVSEPAGEVSHESNLHTENTEETREMVVCTTKPVTTSVEGVSVETESLTDVNSESAEEPPHESYLSTETTEETREMVVCTTKPVTTSVKAVSGETEDPVHTESEPAAEPSSVTTDSLVSFVSVSSVQSQSELELEPDFSDVASDHAQDITREEVPKSPDEPLENFDTTLDGFESDYAGHEGTVHIPGSTAFFPQSSQGHSYLESSEVSTEMALVNETTEIGAAAGGSNVAVIAGASAGAVAGVAAVAALLYKQFGASLLGNSQPELLNMEQMATEESPVERETMQAVTLDLFQ